MKVGFCGLGIMGWPMAGHLAAAGHDVTVWTHSPDKATRWTEAHGGSAASTPAAAADGADVVVLIVGDDAMSADVIDGPEGVLRAAGSGTIVIDSSTVLPTHARAMAAAAAARQVDFLDAPVSGSKGGAEAATLTFMIGGDAEVLIRARPAIEPMAGPIYHCGPTGSGLAAKLVQNTFVTNLCAVFAEAMTLATQAGVDPGLMSEIIQNSAARNTFTEMKSAMYAERDFSPAFSLKWAAKDARLIGAAASALGVPTPLTDRTAALLAAGVDAGLGEDDLVGYVRMIEAAVAATTTTAAPTSAMPDSRSE